MGEGTDENSAEHVEIPVSLARFATTARLSFRQTLLLLDMQRKIIAHRSSTKSEGLDNVDWQGFYDSVKDFL
jgi:hypothetical protein